jgi:hypothetical protein
MAALLPMFLVKPASVLDAFVIPTRQEIMRCRTASRNRSLFLSQPNIVFFVVYNKGSDEFIPVSFSLTF